MTRLTGTRIFMSVETPGAEGLRARTGTDGAPRDPESAAKFFQRACDLGGSKDNCERAQKLRASR